MTAQARGTDRSLRPPPILAAIAGVAAILTLVARIFLAWRNPLWLDEAWTLAIVTPPTWAGFWREAWLDVNAPLYYLVMRLWTSVFGVSNLALKVPGLLAVCIAAALPIALRVKGLSLEARIAWGALIFAWWGVGVFLDARCYTLLIAVSTGQVLAFAALLRAPDRRAAWIWAALASSAILLQYYAIFVGAAQGLMLLATHRQRVLRLWPAALAFAPAFGWIAWHAPRLGLYGAAGVAWHPSVDAAQALEYLAFVVGPPAPIFLAVVLSILVLAILLPRLSADPARDEPDALDRPLLLAAVASLIAVGLILASGAVRPTLTGRYLIPATPGVLLGVVLAARASPRAHLAYLALILLYFAILIRPTLDRCEAPPGRPAYEFQTASERLMAAGATDVVFVWDHEVAPIIDRGSLYRLGSVFFARAGSTARIWPRVLSPSAEPNAAILASVRGTRPGLIWIYNRSGHTAAARSPPDIPGQDPRWRCVVDGDAQIGVVSCLRDAAPAPGRGKAAG